MPETVSSDVQTTLSKYYRLYALDLAGHIVDVRHFSVDGDQQAIVEAEARASELAHELWNEDRRVLEFPPSKPAVLDAASASAAGVEAA